jgi:F-type H+-transporting ATPase subunit delta
MGSYTAARRYAKGLLQVAIDNGTTGLILNDIILIKSVFDENASLRKLIASPVIRDDKKKEIIDEIFVKHISETSKKLLDVLKSKGRLPLLYQITTAFESLYNQYAGIIEIQISTAFELEKIQISSLIQGFETKTGLKVKSSIKTDKSLIGGVTVKHGDTVVDGSIKNKLEQLSASLQRATV